MLRSRGERPGRFHSSPRTVSFVYRSSAGETMVTSSVVIVLLETPGLVPPDSRPLLVKADTTKKADAPSERTESESADQTNRFIPASAGRVDLLASRLASV